MHRSPCSKQRGPSLGFRVSAPVQCFRVWVLAGVLVSGPLRVRAQFLRDIVSRFHILCNLIMYYYT